MTNTAKSEAFSNPVEQLEAFRAAARKQLTNEHFVNLEQFVEELLAERRSFVRNHFERLHELYSLMSGSKNAEYVRDYFRQADPRTILERMSTMCDFAPQYRKWFEKLSRHFPYTAVLKRHEVSDSVFRLYSQSLLQVDQLLQELLQELAQSMRDHLNLLQKIAEDKDVKLWIKRGAAVAGAAMGGVVGGVLSRVAVNILISDKRTIKQSLEQIHGHVARVQSCCMNMLDEATDRMRLMLYVLFGGLIMKLSQDLNPFKCVIAELDYRAAMIRIKLENAETERLIAWVFIVKDKLLRIMHEGSMPLAESFLAKPYQYIAENPPIGDVPIPQLHMTVRQYFDLLQWHMKYSRLVSAEKDGQTDEGRCASFVRLLTEAGIRLPHDELLRKEGVATVQDVVLEIVRELDKLDGKARFEQAEAFVNWANELVLNHSQRQSVSRSLELLLYSFISYLKKDYRSGPTLRGAFFFRKRRLPYYQIERLLRQASITLDNSFGKYVHKRSFGSRLAWLPIAPFERAANALERSEAVLHSPKLKQQLARYYHYASPHSPRLLKPDFILLWLVLGFLLLNAISYAGTRSVFPKVLDEYMLRTYASYTNTSFHAAIAKGRTDRLEHLLSAGHVTSLDWRLLRDALDAGKYAAADKLIQYGVKPTEPRLLLDAVYEKRLDFVKLFLDHGADPNGKGIAGRTALHEASQYGLTSFVKELIARGAQVNAVDDKGVTPVMEAVQGTALGWNDNPIETLKLLYANGASLTVKNQEKKSAYDLAKIGYSSISTSDKVKGKLDTVMRFLLVPESVR